ncbi:DUF732 domain-containing protein [Mycobacterium sp.]|jgi:hypothetical protein|uniref:DUF732 domain-containing protein n=1 Tax=Mycobacterium sp. TaxID=1785 RepID=UPI002BFF966E|nr:DUF732 domain-containing protein [Mycobacterium sp.]HTQ21807.1 DUF732 domain-containing protein [Mycobacterium sp.]
MFSHRSTSSLAGIILTAGTLGLAALGFASTAGATSVDDSFLAKIKADGITPPSAARAIKDAHAVCASLDAGHSAQQVYGEVADATGLDAEGAKEFAVDAASSYCPQYVTHGA